MTYTVTDDVSQDDSVLDEAWLAAPRQRSRLRLVLAGVLAASVCFLGGVLVQKHVGAAAEEAAAGGLPSGFPAGAQAGGIPSGFPGGQGGAVPGGQASQDAGGATEASGADTAVIGTVVEIRGDVWVVEDLGGERHEVRVSSEADIVRETTLTADEVAAGDLVDISGTTKGGQMQANEVTLR